MDQQRKGGMKVSKAVSVASLAVILSAHSAWPLTISSMPDPNVWGVDGIIYSIVNAGNVVYIGGNFTNLVSPDGLTRLPCSNLAALSGDTGQPTSWRPFADAIVYALAASLDDSTIYVGGAFTTINGVPRSGFAAIAPDGNLLWSADCSSTVKALTVWGNNI